MPLELILVDMLRSALAWEQRQEIREDAVSSFTISSTYPPLNDIPEPDETEDENLSE